MSVGSVGTNTTSSSSANSNSTISTTDFYKIITAELQNQDPDDTTSTKDLVEEQMQIANYQTTTQVGEDVTSMKNYITATALVGATVDVTPSSGSSTVEGTVSKASFSGSSASVTVDGTAYDLSTVSNVIDPNAASSGSDSSTSN